MKKWQHRHIWLCQVKSWICTRSQNKSIKMEKCTKNLWFRFFNSFCYKFVKKRVKITIILQTPSPPFDILSQFVIETLRKKYYADNIQNGKSGQSCDFRYERHRKNGNIGTTHLRQHYSGFCRLLCFFHSFVMFSLTIVHRHRKCIRPLKIHT